MTDFELLDVDRYSDSRYVACEIRIELDLVNACTNVPVFLPCGFRWAWIGHSMLERVPLPTGNGKWAQIGTGPGGPLHALSLSALS